jgi:uncharacterized ferritin-like protein (DUF455 family)
MSSDRFQGLEHPRRGVDASANLLKRLYLVEREVMRALGAWHISIANWELKAATPRHLWHDSLHADALRGRVLELRYPKRDVDVDHDPHLVGFLEQLTRADSDAEFALGIYRVVKPALVTAYEGYLAGGDDLDDAPSFYHISHILIDEREHVAEASTLLDMLPKDELEAARPWEDYLRASLAAVGGVLGEGPRSLSPDDLEYAGRAPYEIPTRAARDPRLRPATVESPLRPPRTPREEQVWHAIEHANEVWAAEIPGAFLWHWRDMPWSFYTDVARWSYDEMRHSLMGVRRLNDWGFELGVDYPMVNDPYQAAVDQGAGLLEMLAMLYSFEKDAPPVKQKQKKHFESLEDNSTAQDTDYDWADEAIHLRFGYTWLQHLLGPEAKERMPALVSESNGLWTKWLTERWERGEDGYGPFMERIEAKIGAAEAASRAGGSVP